MLTEPKEDMPPGVGINNKDNDNNNNKTEADTTTVDNNNKGGGVMGDIGNPPRENPHAGGKEAKETDKEVVTSPHMPSPNIPADTETAETIENNNENDDNEEDDIDALRTNSPTPINDSGLEGEEEFYPYPKRTSVFNGREREDTDDFLLSTMLAIRTTVLAGTKDATNVEATPEDFSATRKHKISMAGDRKIEVKDYAPVIFTLIRRKFGISIPAYLLSWSDSRIAKSRSVGKSDSMFIHSPDNKFVLKTLARSEAKRLCKLLQQYYIHITTHKDTFLSRIYGLHRMSRRRGQSNVYFAIFNNVFDSGQPLSEIYDLKGSTVGRKALLGDPSPQRRSSTSFEFRQVRRAITEEQPKKPTVLKDLDFTRQLHIGPENRDKVLGQLAIDCKFLSHHELMDYSLLIGVRRTDTPPPSSIPENPVNDSPKVSRSSATPGSSPDLRVPGLLFFLESTKAASSKSIRETKRDRRKSITTAAGKGLLVPPEDLNAIDEEDKPTGENGEEGEGDKDAGPKRSTPPLSAPLSATVPGDSEESDTTGTSAPTTESHLNESKEDFKDDEEDEPVVPIKVTSSPVPQRHLGGNSGEVGKHPSGFAIPPIKVSEVTSPTTNQSATSNGNVHNEANGSDTNNTTSTTARSADETSDTSTSDSDSPRASLGLLAVNSVPNFNYYGNGNPAGSGLPRTGSGMRYSSASNSPQILKRPNRSASLNYVNLDPLCEPTYTPFHKADEGGMKGTTFLALDPKKSNEIYFIGLIDFLQKYNKKKKLAGFAKSFKYEKEELSTVDPIFYMERFLKMAERAVVE